MTTPADLRAEFPALEAGLCFLDWGATGLLPKSVQASLHGFVDELAACPAGVSTWMHGEHAATRNRARAGAAALLNARADDIALVESTTAALQIASEAIRLQPGDNVLVSELDYLAVVLPWKLRQRADKIEVRTVPCRAGRLEVADVLERLDDRTRVVCVSTIGWTTGALVDVEALAHEVQSRGLFLVLDAVQTFGVVPLDVIRVPAAFVAVGGHKWLCSVLGAGFCYVHPLIAARTRPQRVGFLAGQPSTARTWWDWFTSDTSRLDDDVIFPSQGRSFETGGTPSYPGAIGLAGMLGLLGKVPPGAILAHVRALGDRVIAGLERLGLPVITPVDASFRAGLIVFTPPGGRDGAMKLVADLAARRVVVSARWINGVGGVRISLHAMNDTADVDHLLTELTAALARL